MLERSFMRYAVSRPSGDAGWKNRFRRYLHDFSEYTDGRYVYGDLMAQLGGCVLGCNVGGAHASKWTKSEVRELWNYNVSKALN